MILSQSHYIRIPHLTSHPLTRLRSYRAGTHLQRSFVTGFAGVHSIIHIVSSLSDRPLVFRPLHVYQLNPFSHASPFLAPSGCAILG
jgi:hypothetical protein